jgi:hypothetical protein
MVEPEGLQPIFMTTHDSRTGHQLQITQDTPPLNFNSIQGDSSTSTIRGQEESSQLLVQHLIRTGRIGSYHELGETHIYLNHSNKCFRSEQIISFCDEEHCRIMEERFERWSSPLEYSS